LSPPPALGNYHRTRPELFNPKYDAEKTGLGWKVVKAFEVKDLAQPTICKMKRPGA
jgi:hypothetical protein